MVAEAEYWAQTPDRRASRLLARLGLLLGPLLGTVAAMAAGGEFLSLEGQPQSLSFAGRATVGLAVWMGLWWMTEAVDLAVAALLPLVAFPVLGIANLRDAAAPYADPVIFLFMGGFFLALAMQRWGLGERIAISLISRVGTRPSAVLGMFMLVTAMFSAFVSNTATTAMMLPIGLQVAAMMRRQATSGGETIGGDSFAAALMLGIAYAASIGGMATIIGSPPNVFAARFAQNNLGATGGRALTFGTWMLVGVPIVIVVLPVSWLLLTRILRLPTRLPASSQDTLRSQRAALGKMQWPEYAVLGCFGLAVVLWLTRPWLVAWEWSYGGVPVRPLAYLDDAWIAIAAGLLLCLLPAGRGRGFVLDWKSAAALPWGTLILFGGGLSLAGAIDSHHVSQYIGSKAVVMAGLPGWLVVLFVSAGLVFLSELASNTATAAAAVPILAALAPALELHPLQVVLPATLACSCGFMLPVATPPNAIVYASGLVSMGQMVRAGFWLNLFAIVLVSQLGYWLVRWLIVANAAGSDPVDGIGYVYKCTLL